jgi:phospholipase/carboxylesterase
LLAPHSRAWTWDGIGGSFGPDIKFLDDTLRDVFAKYAIDPRRVSVAGFSDGATMSIALGVANGDLFPRVTAWSPGFLIAGERVGTPAFFISHGTLDAVLPIGSTSREIVPALRILGYAVEYREFIGQHSVPDDVLHESMAWMAG